jgi:hypothetical protein
VHRIDFIKLLGLSATVFILPSLAKENTAGSRAGLPPLLVTDDGMVIRAVSDWEKQRTEILKRWQAYLGVLPPNPARPVIQVIKEDYPVGVIRQWIKYEGEPGITVQAYLLKPQHSTTKLPGVVVLHPTTDNPLVYVTGVEKGKGPPLGLHIAQKGYVVICPMCFLWQDKGGRTYEQQTERFHQRHPGSKGMAKMLFDAQRAVDILTSLEEVDTRRIGTLGHSLGAKEALYLGAFDDRIQVIVSNEGGIGIDFSNWDAPWYLGPEIHQFPHAQHEVLALCAPKPFLLIGGDFADGTKSIPYINAVLPVYKLYGKLQNLQLYNHGQGHYITPEAERRMYDWILTYL